MPVSAKRKAANLRGNKAWRERLKVKTERWQGMMERVAVEMTMHWEQVGDDDGCFVFILPKSVRPVFNELAEEMGVDSEELFGRLMTRYCKANGLPV